jgi:hypothetical protein
MNDERVLIFQIAVILFLVQCELIVFSFETWFDVSFLESTDNAHEQIVFEEQRKHTISMLHQVSVIFLDSKEFLSCLRLLIHIDYFCVGRRLEVPVILSSYVTAEHRLLVILKIAAKLIPH